MSTKIVHAEIVPSPDMFTLPQVLVQMEDSSEMEFLFEYFPDEISFSQDEFIGLTKAEAVSLKGEKDLACLLS